MIHKPVQIFCHELLDKIEKAVGTQAKKMILSEYLHNWRRDYGFDHMNDLLRLIMPEVCRHELFIPNSQS